MSHYAIRPAQVESEFLTLAGLVAEMKPKSILEIGTYCGGTLFVFCRLASPAATVISVDLRRGTYGGGYPLAYIPLMKMFPRNGQRLHLIRGDSHDPETLAIASSKVPSNGLDVLFIDGDHSYEGVRADFAMYSPLVRPGGMIVFHDVVTHAPEWRCDVDRFWNEIKSSYRHREIIANPQQGWGGIGILYQNNSQ